MKDMLPIELAELDAAPFRFTASSRLDADPDAVFAELRDPSLWFPLMRRSVWHTGATSGVGAQREVDMRVFGRFRERMTAWEPGERVAFTMVATTSPLVERMAEDWRITPTDGGSRVDWTVCSWPSTVGRPIQPALRGILRGMFAVAARGLGKRAGSYPRARESA